MKKYLKIGLVTMSTLLGGQLFAQEKPEQSVARPEEIPGIARPFVKGADAVKLFLTRKGESVEDAQERIRKNADSMMSVPEVGYVNIAPATVVVIVEQM